MTGVDTNVGKTFITAGLAAVMQSLGYKSGVYKPIQTGAIEQNGFLVSPDLSYVKQLDFYVETACTYTFKNKVAPVIAAEIENTKISFENINRDYNIIKNNCEVVLVEGVSGLLEPISDDKFAIDIPQNLNIPILLMVNAQTETISNVLLNINKIKEAGIDIVGVLINKYPNKNPNINAQTMRGLIEAYSGEKVLGVIPEIPNFRSSKPASLINVLVNNVDIESIFKIKIPKLNLSL